MAQMFLYSPQQVIKEKCTAATIAVAIISNL